jgi:predicted ATPase
MITRIYADNYRCFTNFTFAPQRLNLLVGDNGSGKSSLLTLLVSLRLLVRTGDALRYAFSDSKTRWDTRQRQRFEIAYKDRDGAEYLWALVLTVDAASGKTRIENETVSKDGNAIAVLEGREGAPRKLHLRGSEVPIPYELEASLLSLRLEDVDLRRLHALISDSTVLKLDVGRILSVSEKPNDGLFPNGENFVSHYRYMRDKDFERTKRLHDRLTSVIGGFRALDLEAVSADSRILVVKLFAGENKAYYTVGFNELSDGQRALVVLYHLVTMFDLRDRVLCIDEPDNYVSLRELQPWLQTLSLTVEDEDAQAIIVSHNPEVIDYLAADSVWLFERDEGGPARVRPLPVDPDSGLRASEQLARGWTRGA